MAKQVYVLTLIDPDGSAEVLGAYSDASFARNQAQIHVNHVNDSYDDVGPRKELSWSPNTDTVRQYAQSFETPMDVDSPFITYVVERTSLDEDVRL